MYLLRTEYATKCISDIAQLFHKCKSLLHFLDFPWGSAGKESACNVRDLGLIPGLGRSPGEGHATHSSSLDWKIPMDRGA